MQFIVRLFPEITIKSKPVRKRFTRILCDNMRKLLRVTDTYIRIIKAWDRIDVHTALTAQSDIERLIDQLQ